MTDDTPGEYLPADYLPAEAFEPDFHPLAHLDAIQSAPTKPVLIVEGEPAVRAATGLFPSWVVCTWRGGERGVETTLWGPLRGRDVVIWPDNDDSGLRAAIEIGLILNGKATRVRVLDVTDQPAGWNAVDAIADGWTPDRVVSWCREMVSDFTPPDVASGHRAAPEPPPQPRAIERAQTGDYVDYYTPLPHLTSKGAPRQTIENLAEIIHRLGVTVRYNVISKVEEILIPGASFSSDNAANASLAWLTSEAAKFNFSPARIPELVTYLADCNQYNPVTTWITSRPWDGTDRIEALLATIQTKPGMDDMKRAFVSRWMLSAVAAAFRPNGVSAHGVLVFQGEQYVGKTKWFKQLVPDDMREQLVKDGLLLRPDDRDSVMRCIKHWLVELGELDATFRKADIASLKSFLTADRDELRRAYDRRESNFARRTVFFASVNPTNYLHDETGNRRYWTIPVTDLDYNHTIDMQQCWAQVYQQSYLAGDSWFLNSDEFKELTEHNRDFEAGDPIEDLIGSGLDWKQDPSRWTWRTATDVLVDLGRNNCSKAEVTKAGIVIRNLNGGRARRTGVARMLLVPDTLVTPHDNVSGSQVFEMP